MNFSLEQLLAFVSVYEQLSFSKAAVKLNKHRTTIGQVITNLEDQLAVTLFNRIGRSVEPTEDGELLYHFAKQALEQARVFDKVALSLSYGALENVTIAYSSIIPQRALCGIRAQLAKDFPTMRVNFIVRPKQAIKQGIVDGSIHFGLVNVHESSGINSFNTKLLGHVEFCPFVQKDSELAKVPSDQIMGRLRSSRQIILKGLVDEGMKEKILFSADHEEIEELSLVVKMVQAGLGWALLPKQLTENFTENVQQVFPDQMVEGFKFSVSLWSPHSKQIAVVRKSIAKSIEQYTQGHRDKDAAEQSSKLS